MSYATDGKCHNAEAGSFGNECEAPATWIGVFGTGFRSGFCDQCRKGGAEARDIVCWEPHPSKVTAG